MLLVLTKSLAIKLLLGGSKINFKTVIKNISYSLSANLFSALISVMMILILPKIMSIEDYGAWQLYVFYLSYIGLFHFGWPDGIYLRYGGYDYKSLTKLTFSGQFYALAGVEIFIAVISISITSFIVRNELIRNILQMVSVVGIFVILITFISFILQFTNRIKDYAKLILYEKILFLFAISVYILLGNSSYKGMLWINFGTNLLELVYGTYLIKEIITVKTESLCNVVKEAAVNIGVGSKLMIANIAGMLLIGIIRFGISQQWDVGTFGKVSLTLTICNFLMVFIGAVGVVLFPILKRVNEDSLPNLYIVLRTCMSTVLLGLLLLYYPLKAGLTIWLPQYAGSLVFMAILFPVCLFDGKLTLLINTYLKSMRQERLILRTNSMALVVSLLSTVITVYWLYDLNLTVLSIIIVFAFRCVLAECYLGKLLNLNLLKEIILELFIISCFIVFSWYIDKWWSVLLYLLVYIYYVWLKLDDLRNSMFVLKELLSNNN